MDKYNFSKTLLALSITAALSACGSSSSDDPTETPPPVTTIEATLAGTAAKGIIISGVVTASELDSSGNVLRVVGTATTDANGRYTMDLNDSYEGGPIVIEVTNDASTTMVCDVVSGCGTAQAGDPLDEDASGTIDFGEQYKPGSLSMTALLPDAEDGESIEVQVTPFTHMAAENALSNATLDTTIIETANALVSNLLGGIDILRTEPVDITDAASVAAADASAVVYAALGASIAELAPEDANGQPDLDAALATLAEEFANGTMSAADDSVDGSPEDDANVSLQEIIQGAGTALAETGSTDTSGVLADLEGDVDDAIAGTGEVTPDTPVNVGDTDVAKAKSFVADLRTWGVTIGSEIESPSMAFENQIDMSLMAEDMIQNDGTGDAIGFGVMAIMENLSGNLQTLTSFEDFDGTTPFSAGTLSMASTADGVEYSITGGELSIDGEDITLDMTVLVPADGAGTVITLGVKNIEAEGDSSILTVGNGTIDVTLSAAYTVSFADLQAGTADEPSAPVEMGFNFDFTATQKKTVDASGMLVDATDPVTFSGDLEATLYPYTVEVTEQGETFFEILEVVPGSFTATGTVGNGNNDSYEITVSASVTDADTLEPVNQVLELDSTYAANNADAHLISWSYSGDTFTYESPYSTFTAVYTSADLPVEITHSYDYGWGYTGTDTYSDFGSYTSIQDFVVGYSGNFISYSNWHWVDGQGDYASYQDPWSQDYSVDGFITFNLEEPDVVFFDADNPALGNVGVQFTAQFAGLPAATVSFTGNATAFEAGNATATISYDNRQLVFSASNDSPADLPLEQGSLEITNQDGVTLTFTGQNLNDGIVDNETVEITINSKAVATVEGLENGSTKVTYIDGTFEIF